MVESSYFIHDGMIVTNIITTQLEHFTNLPLVNEFFSITKLYMN